MAAEGQHLPFGGCSRRISVVTIVQGESASGSCGLFAGFADGDDEDVVERAGVDPLVTLETFVDGVVVQEGLLPFREALVAEG